MEKAVIKDCRYKGNFAELTLLAGTKPLRYEVEITLEDATLLKQSKNCEFEAKGNKLVRLFVEGKEIPLNKNNQPDRRRPDEVQRNTGKNIEKQNNKKTGTRNKTSTNTQASGEYAKAPYNFVPINETVIPAETIPEFDYYHKDRYTGYIDLDIEALTPLYIRDTYTKEEEVLANQAKEACKICKNKDCDKCNYAKHRVNPDFFAPGGIPKIPGSTLRGMVRTLVEIVSYSKMEFTEKNKYFYYRKVANRGRYQDAMLCDCGGLRPKTEAGWLKKEKGKHFIYPLEKQQIYRINAYPKANGSKWKVVTVNDEGQRVSEELDRFDFYPISFIPVEEEIHNHGGGTIKLLYALIEENSFELGHQKAESDERYEKGYLVLSGSIGSKKHLHPVIHCPKDEGRIEVNQDIIKSYEEDMGREPEADLLKMLKKHPDGVPCFYLKDDEGNIKSIGHTPFYRLAYDKTVKEHIPQKNRNFDGIDIATAIFGNADKFAGRVFFEDAKMVKNAGQYPALSPRVLSTPKPTTVQHYLELKTGGIADWNDDTFIRGYKLYWHRRTPQKGGYQWEATEKEKEKAKSQLTLIRPVREGTRFSGRIRFENLSELELGALLFVLELPPKCAHKIGLGKPLGFGSIRINPTLVITNRAANRKGNPGRYEKLFDNKQWYLPVEQVTKDFKAEFSRRIWAALPDEEKTGASSVNDLWSIPRIKELWTMLYYDKEHMENPKWLEKTRYMEIEREGVPAREKNEFKGQPLLPSPCEILNIEEF